MLSTSVPGPTGSSAVNISGAPRRMLLTSVEWLDPVGITSHDWSEPVRFQQTALPSQSLPTRQTAPGQSLPTEIPPVAINIPTTLRDQRLAVWFQVCLSFCASSSLCLARPCMVYLSQLVFGVILTRVENVQSHFILSNVKSTAGIQFKLVPAKHNVISDLLPTKNPADVKFCPGAVDYIHSTTMCKLHQSLADSLSLELLC